MIVVTGATGHIGNVVVKKLLKQNKEVVIITHRRPATKIFKGYDVKEVQGSITDLELLKNTFQKADVVIHLAAKISIQQGEYQQLYETNVIGTKTVMQACLECNVPKVVYVSSVHALFEKPHGQVIDEVVPDNPEDVLGDYAKTKVMAYHEVMKAVAKGLNATVVFPAGVIGPFDYKPSQIGDMIKNFIADKANYYFDGKYNYVDVRDVADGIIAAISLGEKGQGYSLTGEVYSVADFYNLISKVLGRKAKIIKINSRVAYLISFVAEFISRITNTPALFTPYSYKVLQSNSEFSNEKAKTVLNYQPRSVEASLVDAVKWHQGESVPV